MRRPAELWQQARDEALTGNFADVSGREEFAHARYLELMREEGHIVPADHPDAGSKNLPCGYPAHSGGEG